jgi:hypothetical protein
MCGCNGGAPKPAEQQFEVRLPNGTTKVVTGEHAAKVEVTMAGGGTYSAR